MIFLKTIKEPLRFSADGNRPKDSELLFGFHTIRHHWQIESTDREQSPRE
jgi:hypothetical protein